MEQSELFAFCIPDREELIHFLKAGEAERLALIFDQEYRFSYYGQQTKRFDLSGADLSGTHLKHFRFDYISLHNVDLSKSQLEQMAIPAMHGISFKSAFLNGCSLAGSANSEFRGARIQSTTILPNAVFRSSDLSECVLERVTAASTTYTQCNLAKTTFNKCTFMKAIFDNCDLSNSVMDGCALHECQFNGGNLAKASFRNAQLVNARFHDVDLRDCDFTGANLAFADFSTATINGANFSGCNMMNASIGKSPASCAVGLEEAMKRTSSPTTGPNLRELEKAISAASFDFKITFSKDENFVTVQLLNSYSRGVHLIAQNTWQRDQGLPYWADRLSFSTLAQAALHVAAAYQGYTPDFSNLDCKISKGSVSVKEFKHLVIKGFSELLELPVPTDEELKKMESAKKAKQNEQKEKVIELLGSGASGIARLNEMDTKTKTAVSLKRADLSNKDLSGANLECMDMQNVNLEGANLQNAVLNSAVLIEANLKDCKLDKTTCRQLQATKADFTNASLIGADLAYARLNGANLTGANLTNANLASADLQGANLSDTTLAGTTCDGARYNEKTRLPQEFDTTKMTWCGSGTDPAKLKEVMESTPKEPLDFSAFLKRLEDSVDRDRLKKAMKMLKAESFQLFSDVKDNYVVGVVKSLRISSTLAA